MTTTAPQPPPPIQGTNRLPLLCWKCSYQLIGLPLDASCPECGTPIEQSRTNHWRRASSGQHLSSHMLLLSLWLLLEYTLLLILPLLLPFLAFAMSFRIFSTITSIIDIAVTSFLLILLNTNDAHQPAPNPYGRKAVYFAVAAYSFAAVSTVPFIGPLVTLLALLARATGTYLAVRTFKGYAALHKPSGSEPFFVYAQLVYLSAITLHAMSVLTILLINFTLVSWLAATPPVILLLSALRYLDALLLIAFAILLLIGALKYRGKTPGLQ